MWAGHRSLIYRECVQYKIKKKFKKMHRRKLKSKPAQKSLFFRVLHHTGEPSWERVFGNSMINDEPRLKNIQRVQKFMSDSKVKTIVLKS